MGYTEIEAGGGSGVGRPQERPERYGLTWTQMKWLILALIGVTFGIMLPIVFTFLDSETAVGFSFAGLAISLVACWLSLRFFVKKNRTEVRSPSWKPVVKTSIVYAFAILFFVGIVMMNRPTPNEHLPLDEAHTLYCGGISGGRFRCKTHNIRYNKARAVLHRSETPQTLSTIHMQYSIGGHTGPRWSAHALRYITGYNPFATFGLFPERESKAKLWFELAMPGATHGVHINGTWLTTSLLIKDAEDTKGNTPLAYALPAPECDVKQLCWTVVVVDHPDTPLFELTTSTAETGERVHYVPRLSPDQWSALSPEAARLHEVISKQVFWSSLAVAGMSYFAEPTNNYPASYGWFWGGSVFLALFVGAVMGLLLPLFYSAFKLKASPPMEEWHLLLPAGASPPSYGGSGNINAGGESIELAVGGGEYPSLSSPASAPRVSVVVSAPPAHTLPGAEADGVKWGSLSKKVIIGLLALFGLACYLMDVIFTEENPGAKPWVWGVSILILFVACAVSVVTWGMNLRREQHEEASENLVALTKRLCIVLLYVLALLCILALAKFTREPADPQPLGDTVFDFIEKNGLLRYREQDGHQRTTMSRPLFPGEAMSVSASGFIESPVHYGRVPDYELRYAPHSEGFPTYGLFPATKTNAQAWFAIPEPGANLWFFHSSGNATAQVFADLLIQDGNGQPLAYAPPTLTPWQVNWTLLAIGAEAQPLLRIIEINGTLHIAFLTPPENWATLSPEAARLHAIISQHNFCASIAMIRKGHLVAALNQFPVSKAWEILYVVALCLYAPTLVPAFFAIVGFASYSLGCLCCCWCGEVFSDGNASDELPGGNRRADIPFWVAPPVLVVVGIFYPFSVAMDSSLEPAWVIFPYVFLGYFLAPYFRQEKAAETRLKAGVTLVTLYGIGVMLFLALSKAKVNPARYSEGLSDQTFAFSEQGNSLYYQQSDPYAYWKTRTELTRPKAANQASLVLNRRAGHQGVYYPDHELRPLETASSASAYSLFAAGNNKKALLHFMIAKSGQDIWVFNGTHKVATYLIILDGDGAFLAYASPDPDRCYDARVCWKVVTVRVPDQLLFSIEEPNTHADNITLALLLPANEWSALSPEAKRLHEVMTAHNFWSSLALAEKGNFVGASNTYQAARTWEIVATVFGTLLGVVSLWEGYGDYRERKGLPFY